MGFGSGRFALAGSFAAAASKIAESGDSRIGSFPVDSRSEHSTTKSPPILRGIQLSKQNAANSHLERLNVFVGTWKTEGEMRSTPSAKHVGFTAADTYEWLPGGYFLMHRFDADMPDGNVKGIEVIGYSPESMTYPMYSFDSMGNMSIMQASVEGIKWAFTGEDIRFTGGFRDDAKIFAGFWEIRSGEGAHWQPWMDVTLKKVE